MEDSKPAFSHFLLSRSRFIQRPFESNQENDGLFIGSLYSDNLRITSCPAYRRLQDKTQLFPLEKNDYARTRLTHSCEVSSTARALASIICHGLRGRKYIFSPAEADILSMSTVNCGLLHDIGNPPFGHYGEDIIRSYFVKNWETLTCSGRKKTEQHKLSSIFKNSSEEYFDFAAFDGNAQALRIVTKLENYNGDRGLNLTASVLGGIIKYPFDSVAGKKKKKFGFFKSESDVIDFLNTQSAFFENQRNPVALIMEAADDICMFVSDFQDGVKKGCISYDDIAGFKSKRNKLITEFRDKEFIKAYKKNTSNKMHGDITLFTITRLLNKLKNDLILECAGIFLFNADRIFNGESPLVSPEDGTLTNKALLPLAHHYPIVEMEKILIKDHVYNDPLIVKPELKGNTILTYLLDAFVKALLSKKCSELDTLDAKQTNDKYLQMISKNYFRAYEESLPIDGSYDLQKDIYGRLRLAVDQVCGMTDSYAEDLYLSLAGK